MARNSLKQNTYKFPVRQGIYMCFYIHKNQCKKTNSFGLLEKSQKVLDHKYKLWCLGTAGSFFR